MQFFAFYAGVLLCIARGILLCYRRKHSQIRGLTANEITKLHP